MNIPLLGIALCVLVIGPIWLIDLLRTPRETIEERRRKDDLRMRDYGMFI